MPKPKWYGPWKAKLKAEGKWKPRKQVIGDSVSRKAEMREMRELYLSKCEKE